MKSIAAAIALVVLCAALVIANYIQSLPTLQFAVPAANDLAALNWGTIVLQGVVLIIGMLFGHFHRVLTELRAQGIATVDIRATAGDIGKSTTFWIALTAAPIIFGIVVVLSGPLPLGTALFLAFQNGFFWERVMPQGPVELGATGQQ